MIAVKSDKLDFIGLSGTWKLFRTFTMWNSSKL